MSYILDALRKSEQQRQATQPDDVTDRILITPPPSKPTSTKWIILLVTTNLLLASYFYWYFSQTKTKQPNLDIQIDTKRPNQLNQPVEKLTPSPESTALNQTGYPTENTSPDTGQTESSLPSLSQLVQNKKMAGNQRPNVKPTPEKKPLIVKKEASPRAIETQTRELEAQQTIAFEATPSLKKTSKQGISDINDLPYEIRNQLPNLAINVFSYAYEPESRFVIIDMVKYKTGQLIKGIVKLKEIRPDSIIVEYGNNTFRVERP